VENSYDLSDERSDVTRILSDVVAKLYEKKSPLTLSEQETFTTKVQLLQKQIDEQKNIKTLYKIIHEMATFLKDLKRIKRACLESVIKEQPEVKPDTNKLEPMIKQDVTEKKPVPIEESKRTMSPKPSKKPRESDSETEESTLETPKKVKTEDEQEEETEFFRDGVQIELTEADYRAYLQIMRLDKACQVSN
jgi:hypothetical protein